MQINTYACILLILAVEKEMIHMYIYSTRQKKLNKSTVNGNGTTAQYHPKYRWSTSEVP